MIDIQPLTLAECTVAGVGLLQCALIWGGLRQIRRASDSRDRQMDAQVRKLDAQLEALSVLIERTGGRGTT